MSIRRTRRFVPWLLLVAAVVIGVVAFTPFPPNGRFSTPEVGNMADAYFELAHGTFTHVVWTGEGGRSGEAERQVLGDYRKEQGRWILVDRRSGSTSELHATIFSLEIVEDEGTRFGPWRRLFR